MTYLHRFDQYQTAGLPLKEAHNVILLLHGRGSNALNILTLAAEIDLSDACFIAPQATQNSWYPFPFIAPITQNEPALSSALEMIGNWIKEIQTYNISTKNIYLLGFSQGACLSLEFAARNAMRYGGVFGLSGGLIGQTLNLTNYKGNFEEMPIFLGCSDTDPHIPKNRVLETEKILQNMGAKVQTKLYPNGLHTVYDEEIEIINKLIK